MNTTIDPVQIFDEDSTPTQGMPIQWEHDSKSKRSPKNAMYFIIKAPIYHLPFRISTQKMETENSETILKRKEFIK